MTSSGIRQEFRFYRANLAHPKVLATSATLILVAFLLGPVVQMGLSFFSLFAILLEPVEGGSPFVVVSVALLNQQIAQQQDLAAARLTTLAAPFVQASASPAGG